jgi:hypothetical protein
MNIHTHFQSFQEKQSKQFFDFQKNQFQEFLALFPDRDLKTSLESKATTVNPELAHDPVQVIKPKKKKVKRSANAFTFFTKKNRASIKSANPDATFGEMASLVGSAWKALTEDEKKPFVKLAEEAKAQLKAECEDE